MSSPTTSSAGYGLAPVAAAGTAPAPALSYLPARPRAYRPRLGLIGCGGISEYHLRAYRALDLEVVALCDLDLARAEKRRVEFYPDATVCSDYRELLRRDDLAVVDLALHPAERVAAIEAALRARKHVLSQKPFVLDLDVGARLADLADAQGVRLAVNQNGRWAPHFAWMTALRAGLIGEIASADMTLQWDHTWTAGTPFEAIHHLVLFDFGIHWFDLAAQLTRGRPPARVWASVARAPFQQMKPPMLAHVVIDFAGTQVRLCFNGHVRHGQEDRTVVCGAAGTLRSTGPSLSEQSVFLHTAAGSAQASLEGSWFTNGFQGAMAELLCAIEENREPNHSARNNLESLALCFAALASADSGQPQIPGSIRRVAGHP
ncbi:MAG: Gfo/Idh/MocA family oxidoreductase [Verrucomicrobia bacterium]|nr:Gfo/Idh/MocA family oxidoreductase [Verrucomicrobiota bacterium]